MDGIKGIKGMIGQRIQCEGDLDAGATASMVHILGESIAKVASWVEDHDFKAYDPGDGARSFLRHLTFRSHLLRRFLTGAVLRTPFHIRPWIGIKPHTSTKGMGYMGWGYTRMYGMTHDASDRRRAEACFEWLTKHKAPDWTQYCWGNDFSFSTRAGTIPEHTPTIVWSSLIGLAFLDAYETFCTPAYLDIAVSVADWVKHLPRERTSTGTCLSYVPFRQSSIHNSNMLGGSLLASVGTRTGDREALDLAREAIRYSCARQRNDGSWWYGEELKYNWIDNFHTGYNLDSLKRYIHSTGDREFALHLCRGFEYFKNTFFAADGRPKYYHNRANPIDIQCAAQAIDTLAYFSDLDPDAITLAEKVACWTIREMQAPDGHFYYRDLGWTKVKTPMLHWGQATMFAALAHLSSKAKGVGAPEAGCHDPSGHDSQPPMRHA